MNHLFSLFDTNIVVDANSLKVHVFDDLAFRVLELYHELSECNASQIIEQLSHQYPSDQITEAISEINQLKEAGELFSGDPLLDFDNFTNKRMEIKALCLHVAHDCNIRCAYCFASCGDYKSQRGLMDAETGKKAIDFVILNAGVRQNIEVDFFGGEPLLNFQVVKEIVTYAMEQCAKWNKNFRFTITTNAMLLDAEKMEFINQYMNNIVLSLDGREEVNDRMRRKIDGSGTYKQVVPNILEMVKRRHYQNYYVRGTFTRKNSDFSKDVLHIADLGIDQISVEPVVANKDSGYELRREDLPQLFAEYENLAKEYVKRQKAGNGFNFFHFMLDLENGPCAAKRVYGCGAGFDYVAVTPEGDIYPCHQFVGMESFKLGNVEQGITQPMLSKGFIDSHIYNKEACRNCWAKFFCSGGCTANAYQFNSRLDKPYEIACELMKKRVECALWVKTQLE